MSSPILLGPIDRVGPRFFLRRRFPALALAITVISLLIASRSVATAADPVPFHLEEATIADIQAAILARQLTATALVKLYLARIKAYNGMGVEMPQGLLGPSVFIAHAKGINALSTLNLRPATREALGFDAHHGRSMTDLVDDDPNMPDALEVAAKLDAEFARTGKLVGPLHGVVMAIKDQYDTFDMRTTSGTDAFYAQDRPPHDATFVARLRAAGAIILAKANVAEDASGAPRSAFGGTFLNPYDTERSPSGSSSGSGSSVAANLVTCAIGEETTTSIRGPAHWNCDVGFAATQELVSRAGMMGYGLNTRPGPITRSVEDAARILSVIAGYDRNDAMTAFAVGRMPDQPYESFTHERSLKGLRIGVVREYMDPALFSKADEESIGLANKAIEELRALGATIVDPGIHGELFTPYIRELSPRLLNITFAKQHPEAFPVDEAGRPTSDQITSLIDMTMDPSLAPGKFTLRDLGGGGGVGGQTPGETRFEKNLYWRQRGDAAITNLTDRANKAHYYIDPAFPDRKPPLVTADKARVLDTTVRLQRRFAVQQMILQAFADLNLDAVVYPTGTLPPAKLGTPPEPTVNGRSSLWTFLGTQGFPAITVPAGFTTLVYDRVADPSAPMPPSDGRADRRGGEGEGRPAVVPSRMVGPFPAVLPFGIDFLGRPFSEPTLLKIAAAYEQDTKLRRPPPDFGPVPGEP
jgi:amidase